MNKERNNEQMYTDAAEIIDTTANFIGWNFGECVNVSKNYDKEKGITSVRFSAGDEIKKRLTDAVDQKNADTSEDGERRFVNDETGNVLAEIRNESDGFTVSISDKLLHHDRFGGIVHEVWSNICE